MAPKPPIQRTPVAGGAAFVGSRRGDEGLLFDPDTQHPKVLAVWKRLEPLPG